MSRDSKLSFICHLIDQSLRPYTESELISLTKEKENDLLIALSQVLREIQLWTPELDCDSDNEMDWKFPCEKKFFGGSELRYEDHNCLTKILAELVRLLTVESRYIRHLVGNILSIISKSVAASGNEWDSLIRSLCMCLELAIANVLSYSLVPSTDGIKDSTSRIIVLKQTLKNANWYTATGIIRVLRDALKHLRQQYDNQLLEVYLGSVSSFLSNVPWDSVNETHFGQSSNLMGSDTQNSSSTDALSCTNPYLNDPKVVFLGNFIQLLCSLVQQISDLESVVGSQGQHPALGTITGLVPKLLCWCLGKQGDCVKMSVAQYFRHKLLMLMLRLSYQTYLGCSTLVSWLQLLHMYFEELLWRPIPELKSSQDESLEGSPFLTSLSDGEVHCIHSLHLQRQAIFLFLRCCFCVISLTGDTTEHCACATLNSCSTFDPLSNLDCCSRKTSYLELYKWLQGQLPTNVFVDHEVYQKNCIGFAVSFIQLYMHEDDVLFKVLLELLTAPSSSEQQLHGEKWTCHEVKENILFHVSNLFNPVYLFHIFLAELHYDHQVLLDYLISKDTGISCAEYLLRSLHTVCDSWNLFVCFSMDGKFVNQSSCKKRKFLLDGSNFLAEPLSVPSNGVSSFLDKEYKRHIEYGCNYKIKREPFDKAKYCLMSLKDSVQNLHRKNLFPYNPEVLLKRLRKFQELCFDEKSYEL